MNLGSATPDLSFGAPGGPMPSNQFDRALAIFVSLVLHAAILFLLIVGVVVSVTPKASNEIAVQVVVEAPPTISPPVGGGLPNIEDEAKKAKAPIGPRIVDGRGTDQKNEGAPDEPDQSQDRQKSQSPADWDNGEAIGRVKPALDSARKPFLAPPGRARIQATVKDTADAKGLESAIKKQKITCGVSAHLHMPPVGKLETATVLGFASRRQTLAMIQKTQQTTDMYINQNYIDNTRVFIHRDGTQPGNWKVLLLPFGLNVKTGDRIEYMSGYVDPTQPCHYVPSLGRRVL